MAYSPKPVPQNIMSVEFKIFDLVTVKQFMISFVIIVISGILFYFLNGALRVILPMILIGGGAIVLFVPFNGEPFQDFLGAFLEALISPQRRIWNKKGIVIKSALKKARIYQFGDKMINDQNTFHFSQQTQQNPLRDVGNLDKEEQSFLSSDNLTQNYNPPKIKPIQHLTSRQAATTQIASKSLNTNVKLNQYTSNHLQQKPSIPISPAVQPLQQQAQPIPQQSVNPINAQITTNNQYQDASPNPIQVPINTQSGKGQIAFTPHSNPSLSNTEIQPPKTVASVTNDDDIDELVGDVELSALEEEKLMVKNYIFGNIEDENSHPVDSAAVIIKRQEENLETLTSNDNGDFQTKYEYPAGEFTLYVNKDGMEFNHITINHDPSDPAPIQIRPRIYEVGGETPFTQGSDTESNEQPDIFTGNYDSQIFNVGNDYNEVMTDENLHDEFEKNTVNRSQLDAVNDSVNSLIDFMTLPTANENFDPTFINIQNTINGYVQDKNDMRISGCLISIFDLNNQLVRTVATDHKGIFYSYSSFDDGKYIIKISKDTFDFENYIVHMSSSIIEPKIIIVK